jgi:hypothetical protein
MSIGTFSKGVKTCSFLYSFPIQNYIGRLRFVNRIKVGNEKDIATLVDNKTAICWLCYCLFAWHAKQHEENFAYSVYAG